MDRRIGEVEMATMLMLLSPKVWNVREATPGDDFMPVPTSDTFAMSSSTMNSRAPISGTMRSMVSLARGRSAPGVVKEISVKPASDTFWMIMSRFTLAAASAPNTRAATFGASGTWRMVTFTSDVSLAMPVMTASSISYSSLT